MLKTHRQAHCFSLVIALCCCSATLAAPDEPVLPTTTTAPTVVPTATTTTATTPAPAETTGPTRWRTAVLDFKGDAASPATIGAARALTTLITNELSTTNGYAPLSNNELRSIVGHAAQQQLLGCEDVACTADIARLAAVDRVVFGSIEKAATDATTLVFSVTMVDPAAEGGPQVVSRFTTTWFSPADALVDVARPAVQRLTRIGRTEPLFKGRPRSTPCETALLLRLTVR